MKRANPVRQRLAALALLAAVLLTYPMLNMLTTAMPLGIPVSALYLFGVWLVIILLAMSISEGGRRS